MSKKSLFADINIFDADGSGLVKKKGFCSLDEISDTLNTIKRKYR